MSFLAKTGLFIVGLIIVIFIALTILVKTQVTPEKVRETVAPLAERHLQRTIDFGDISVGLFSGISLADFEIREKNSDTVFIRLKKLTLSYRLWALLKGKVVIDQVELVEPEINIVRKADGSFNFDDLTGGSASTTAAQTGKKDSGTGALGSLLVVNRVSISDGTILFVDQYTNPKSPYRYTLSELNFTARDIALDKLFPFDFSSEINGSKLMISGHYNLAMKTGDIYVDLAPLELVQFAPYYRDSLPGKLGSAKLGLTLDATLLGEAISTKGKVILNDLDLVLDSLPDAPLNHASLQADYSVNFNTANRLLELPALLVNFNGISAEADGTLDLGSSDPKLDLNLVVKKLDLRQAIKSVPEALVRSVADFSPAGMISARFKLVGPLSRGAELLNQAEIGLEDVQASVSALRAGISGDISYRYNSLGSNNLALVLGDQRLDLDFAATNIFSRVIKGDFGLSARELDLNQLLGQLSSGQPAIVAGGSSDETVVAEELGPFDLPLDMQGTLKIDKMIYKRLPLERVVADMTLKNNQLKITNLSSSVGRGELKLSSNVDLGVKGLQYQGQMNMQMPDVTTLLNGLLPGVQQQVSGAISWQNSFAGQGTLPKRILNALQMQGEVSLSQGSLQNVALVEQLASFIGAPELKSFSYDSFNGRYNLRNGLTYLNTELNSSVARLAPKGTVGVDGDLDLSLNTKLSPQLMKRLGDSSLVNRFLVDNEGWGQVPLQVGGSLISPKIGFDAAALEKQAIEKAKQEAEKRLLEKLVPKEAEQGTQEPVKQLLDQTLNKLFGQ